MSKFKVGDIVRTKSNSEIQQWLREHGYEIPFGWNDNMGGFSERVYRVVDVLGDRRTETDAYSHTYRLEDLGDTEGQRFHSNGYRVNYFSWSWPMLELLDENL